jgi:hypothetical protein
LYLPEYHQKCSSGVKGMSNISDYLFDGIRYLFRDADENVYGYPMWVVQEVIALVICVVLFLMSQGYILQAASE